MEKVVVGFLDGPVVTKKSLHFSSTIIGGIAKLPPGVEIPAQSCSDCAAPLSSVFQAYACLDGVAEHRILYIFACHNCGSLKNWKAFRVMYKESDKKSKAKKKDKQTKTAETPVAEPPKSNEWDTGNANDWGTEASDSWGVDNSSGWDMSNNSGNNLDSWGVATSDEWSTTTQDNTSLDQLEDLLKLRDLSLDDKPAPKPTAAPATPKAAVSQEEEQVDFTAEWISVEYEENLIAQQKVKTQEYVESSETGGSHEEWSGEKYEKSTILEKSFEKFKKVMERNPEQILRYEFNGEPMWNNQKFKPTVSTCQCGAQRVFEFQIMPQAINWISQNLFQAQAKKNLIDYGAIYLFSCQNSCALNTIIEEFVFVQPTIDSEIKL